MKKVWFIVTVIIISFIGVFAINSYNNLQFSDERVNASMSEVINQYQRRADLIPNLVNTVKGYALHEKEVFTQVTNARAKVGSIKISADNLNDPKIINQFQKAQGELTNALSRLLVISENYPQLKADLSFRDLQAQLEGTENRITVARNRYIQAVQQYNVKIRTFPTNLLAEYLGLTVKKNFNVTNQSTISKSPQVHFGSTSNAIDKK